MGRTYVRVVQGVVRQVPRNGTPDIQIDHEDFETVLNVKATPMVWFEDRKTDDWSWEAFVARPANEPRRPK
jgi:hypothetical protein